MALPRPILSRACQEAAKVCVGKKVRAITQDQSGVISCVFESLTLSFTFTRPFERITLEYQPRPTHPSLFAEKCQELLQGASCVSIDLLEGERIAVALFSTGTQLVAQLYPLANLYCIDRATGRILQRLYAHGWQEKAPEPHVRQPLPLQAPWDLVYSSASFWQALESTINTLSQKQTEAQQRQVVINTLEREKQSLLTALTSLTGQLAKASQWEEAQHHGDLLKAHFHLLGSNKTSAMCYDWVKEEVIEIALNPALEAAEQLAYAYTLSRKLKASREPLQARYNALSHKLCHVQKTLSAIEEGAPCPILSSAPSPQKRTSPKASPQYHTFMSSRGRKIWVGRNAEGNQEVTLRLAKGNDMWLHAHHHAGAHVVISCPPSAPSLDDETLLEAALLALWFSKARAHFEDVHEVLCQKRRFISRRKGAAVGMVEVAGGRHLSIKGDKARVNRLLHQNEEH